MGRGVLPLLVTYRLSPVTDLNAVCRRINSMTLTLLRKSLLKIIMSNLSPHLRGYQSPNWPLHRSQQKDRRRRTCNHLHLMQVDTKIRIQQQRWWHPLRVKYNQESPWYNFVFLPPTSNHREGPKMVLSFHPRKMFFVHFRFFFIEISRNTNYVNFSKYLSYRCLQTGVHIRSFLETQGQTIGRKEVYLKSFARQVRGKSGWLFILSQNYRFFWQQRIEMQFTFLTLARFRILTLN